MEPFFLSIFALISLSKPYLDLAAFWIASSIAKITSSLSIDLSLDTASATWISSNLGMDFNSILFPYIIIYNLVNLLVLNSPVNINIRFVNFWEINIHFKVVGF